MKSERLEHGQRPYEPIDSIPESLCAHRFRIDLTLLKRRTRKGILDNEFDKDLGIDLTECCLKGFNTWVRVEHKLESRQRFKVM